MPFALLNYSSLFYTVLALSSAINYLSNKTLILHDFQGRTIKFHFFPGLENKILNFHDFPGNVSKPCNVFTFFVCYDNVVSD